MPADQSATTAKPIPPQSAAVVAVKAWMAKRGYSSAGGDNVGFILASLEEQIWQRVRANQKEPANAR